MTTPLPDTSIWIQHLRGVPAVSARMRPWIDGHIACICEPVAMELLSGIPEREADQMEQLIDQMPALSFDSNIDFRVAADLQRRVRASGHTLRSPFDALIAAVAMRDPDIVLIHDDADFERIAAVAPLRHERWSRTG